jgi:hypothetical protein
MSPRSRTGFLASHWRHEGAELARQGLGSLGAIAFAAIAGFRLAGLDYRGRLHPHRPHPLS